ncbi:MAG: hypothetical protein ACKPKO_45860, partial [Candidatus Fonsibacter sp.]
PRRRERAVAKAKQQALEQNQKRLAESERARLQAIAKRNEERVAEHKRQREAEAASAAVSPPPKANKAVIMKASAKKSGVPESPTMSISRDRLPQGDGGPLLVSNLNSWRILASSHLWKRLWYRVQNLALCLPRV